MESGGNIFESAVVTAGLGAGGLAVKHGAKFIPERINVPQPILNTIESGKELIEQKVTGVIDRVLLKTGDQTVAQIQTAYDRGVRPHWVDNAGSLRYPENNGFDGSSTSTVLQPGTRLDRFGGESGSFLSPEGTPFAERALPSGSFRSEYHQYEVVKPLPVESGTAKPWFDHPGGGTQFYLGRDAATGREIKVEKMIVEGYLRRVGE